MQKLETFSGTLILAGDLHEAKKINHYRDMLAVACSKATNVVLVPGNHEYYGSNIESVNAKLKVLQNEFENLLVLLNEIVYIDGVRIIGSTMWTDFDRGNPLTLFDATIMNDYKYIRNGPPGHGWRHKLKPYEVEDFHRSSVKFLENALMEFSDEKKIVVTHHSPSFQSTPQMYLTDKLNGCYSSNMDGFIWDHQPDFWIHGHIHANSDYMIGDTRVLCNPAGYNETENREFDTHNVYEL